MLMKFLRDRCGNVLPTFAITLVPLIVTTGGVVDYSRAYDQKTAVQDAMDSAALAAGKKIGLVSETAVKAEANDFFNSNITGKVDNLPVLTTDIAGSTVTITTNLVVPTYFLGIIGLNRFDFPLTAKATLAMGTLEVAMVLDNSTSMKGTKIDTLKTAATNLTNTIYALGATSTKTDPVKMALIPFGASVNVGPGATFVDTTGKGTYAGDSLEANGAASGTNPYDLLKYLQDSSGNAVTWGGCVEERPAPYDVTDDPATSASSPSADEAKTLFVPMVAPDEPDNWTCSTSKCDYAGTSTSTRRYNGAPTGSQSYNNYLPDDGNATTCAADYSTVTMTKATPAVFTRSSHGLSVGSEIVFSTTGALYSGVTAGTPYYVASVKDTNNFYVTATSGSGTTTTISKSGSAATFTTSSRHGLAVGDPMMLRTTGSLYTGLSANTVYYVKTVPSTKTFTLSATSGGSAVSISGSQSGTQSYVELASTTGSQSGTQSYNKTVDFTCADGSADCGGSGIGKSETTAFAGNSLSSAKMCKYGSSGKKATISSLTIGGFAGGPNSMCTTTAITPLTTTKQTVVDAIAAEQANGYTNITGGLMWGWRVLSAGAPFSEGRAKSDTENQKIMILMTDGANTYNTNSKFLSSTYSAWGYIAQNHLDTTSNSESDVVAKMEGRMALACTNAKTDGIKIYTIAFQITDETTLGLLSDCASDPSKAFKSDNNDALLAAFSAIGDDISLLRISQ
jgi:Flp pilus assembly protein TadG